MPKSRNISNCFGAFLFVPGSFQMVEKILAYLLPIFLLIWIAFQLLRNIARKRHDVYEFISQRWKGIMLSMLVAFFFFVDLPFLMEKNQQSISGSNVTYWLLTISGNWNAQPPLVIQNAGYWYDFSAVLAILLNNSFFLVIIAMIFQLTFERRKSMKYADALAMKDGLITLEIENQFSDNKELLDRIKSCLVTVDGKWKGYVTSSWGRKQSKAFFDSLNTEVSPK